MQEVVALSFQLCCSSPVVGAKWEDTGCQVGVQTSRLIITTAGFYPQVLTTHQTLPGDLASPNHQLSPLIFEIPRNLELGWNLFWAPHLDIPNIKYCHSYSWSPSDKMIVLKLFPLTCRSSGRITNGYINSTSSCPGFICRETQGSQISFRQRHKHYNLLKRVQGAE